MRKTVFFLTAILFASSVSYANESHPHFQKHAPIASDVVTRAANRTIELEASAGYYEDKTIGDLSEISKFLASFRITKQYLDSKWPSAAYAGFYQGQDQSDSFQFLIIKDPNVKNSEMAVGYRIIERGKEKTKVYLATIEASSYTNATLECNKGKITIRYDKQKPIIIKTHLKKVIPYISVSSGTAEFKIHP